MIENRVQFRQAEVAVEYKYPLTRTLLTATTEGTAQTIGTIRAESLGELEKFAVSNQTGSAAALTFYAIPDGDAIGAANREITALSIPGNTNVDLSDFVGGLYAPSTELKAFASTGSALIVMGAVRGVL